MKFVDRWPTDSTVEWRKEGRAGLNKVIDEYNDWQVEGCENARGQRLLRLIEKGKQTFGDRDGGGGWLEELLDMETYVKAVIRE